jgi:hypothetical protein
MKWRVQCSSYGWPRSCSGLVLSAQHGAFGREQIDMHTCLAGPRDIECSCFFALVMTQGLLVRKDCANQRSDAFASRTITSDTLLSRCRIAICRSSSSGIHRFNELALVRGQHMARSWCFHSRRLGASVGCDERIDGYDRHT